MTHTEITLAEGDKLQIQWEKGHKSLEILQNQQTIAHFTDVAALKLGHQVALPDGRKLTVILANHGLEIWQGNIEVMSGLKSGGADLFARAVSWLLGFGALQVGAGALLSVFLSSDHEMKWLGFGAIISGALLAALGFWAKKSQTSLPLYIGCGYAVLNILLTLLAGQIGGIVLSGLLAHALFKGARQGPLNKPTSPVFGENGPLDGDL